VAEAATRATVRTMQKLARDHECCNAEQAWEWVIAVSELAVDGDDDARRWLPRAIMHYLEAVRRQDG